MMDNHKSERKKYLKKGVSLEWLTIGWNLIEAIIALGAGISARSIALVGFGLDSVIEMTSGMVLLWRLRKEIKGKSIQESLKAEKRSLLVVGITFFLLAIYVAFESGKKILRKETPEESIIGILLAILSLIVMPLLSSLKWKTAKYLDSKALKADAMETAICAYLSLTLLSGLLLNASLGWWWADPVAALAMLPVIIKEGWESFSSMRG